MKKWWILLAVVAVAAGGIGLVVGGGDQPLTVDTAVLHPRSVEQTVSCSGVIESRESLSVTLDTPCIIRDVLVEEGQSVEAGNVLAYVDKEASRRAGFATEAGEALSLATMAEEVVAPRAGVVMNVAAVAGQPLEKGSPCVVLAPRDSLQVRVSIREKDLPRLQEGLKARITGEGFARAGYAGHLTDIAATANVTPTGDTVVEGVVQLDEGQADDSMRLGLTAKARVVVSAMEGVLVVPYEALREDDDGQAYVYVLENGLARRQGVEVKEELSDGALLTDTALAGVTVILQPEQVPADGMAVAAAGEVTS